MDTRAFISAGCLLGALATASIPGTCQGRTPPPQTGGPDGAVRRIMALDTNHDGKVTRAELKDPRFQALFGQADANHDGALTPAELTAFFQRRNAAGGQQGFQGPGGPGPDGRPSGARRRPGQILPGFMQDALKLSDQQKKQIAQLQAVVDARLAKILTPAQRKQMTSMRPGGRGGQGGPGRPGGPGGPGGQGGPGGPRGQGGPGGFQPPR